MLSRLLPFVSPAQRRGPRTGPHGTVIKTSQERFIAKGHGNWACWETSELDRLHALAESWASQLPAGDKFWLCWNNDDAWCRLQQRLVLAVGWTPIVGIDRTLAAKTTILEGAIGIDFQKGLEAPEVWMHFPIELVFGWVKRLAFWHSDVLLPLPVMRDYAMQFDELHGPRTAAVFSRRSLLHPRAWNNADRWFEVIGCTTSAASEDQWRRGSGWWKHFQNHPNCPPVSDLNRYHWDHGGGIRYWQRAHGGEVVRLQFDRRFHATHYERPDLRPRGCSLGDADLKQMASELDICQLLDV